MQIIFLGTAGSIPTPKRNLPSILIRREGEQIMFDCGEGTQRQMIKAGVGFHRKMKIFITHMHGDHVLGLPGLVQTMALLGRTEKLDIYGPAGIREFMEGISETVQFNLTFPLEIHEVREAGTICKEKCYEIKALWADHFTPSLAYALVENPRPGKFYPKKAKAIGVPEGPLWGKLQRGEVVQLPDGRVIRPEDVLGPPRRGRKIVYTGDTRPFDGLVDFAAEADVLIHDSTLSDELAERAKEDGHSTPSQAAEIAKRAQVKKLVLTHISARYADAEILLAQARSIMENTVVAEDFLKIDVPLSDEKFS
ncbi:ribonuclease Z [Candidatus Bathyarchaeota archaeon]|nr:ribonuclease Z [Candidatus Bathyarchaeota archaeon]